MFKKLSHFTKKFIGDFFYQYNDSQNNDDLKINEDTHYILINGEYIKYDLAYKRNIELLFPDTYTQVSQLYPKFLDNSIFYGDPTCNRTGHVNKYKLDLNDLNLELMGKFKISNCYEINILHNKLINLNALLPVQSSRTIRGGCGVYMSCFCLTLRSEAFYQLQLETIILNNIYIFRIIKENNLYTIQWKDYKGKYFFFLDINQLDFIKKFKSLKDTERYIKQIKIDIEILLKKLK